MGEDGEERPADFDQIVENTGLDPEQVGLTMAGHRYYGESRASLLLSQTSWGPFMIFSLESDNCSRNKFLVISYGIVELSSVEMIFRKYHCQSAKFSPISVGNYYLANSYNARLSSRGLQLCDKISVQSSAVLRRFISQSRSNANHVSHVVQ